MPFNIVAAQLHKKRASVRWAGGMGHLAAEFTATGLWELLHTDARDLSGEAHLLSTLHRRIDSALLDACTTHGPSLAAVQLALGPFTAEARTAPDFVSETVRQIEVSAGQVRLGDLCREMGISPPTLNKWFQQVVGLPPKYFSRVAQFNHLATLILSNDTLSLSLLAAEAGFYDQAHFTRAVREFVIMTPRAFLESDFSNIATFLRQIK
jgi:AraC-like DNA-binding protein